MKKRIISAAMAALMLLPTATALSGCRSNKADIVLKVYSWEEYIDEGGEGSYVYDMLLEEGEDPSEDEAPAIIDDFQTWYEETYGQSVRVEYSTFGTNEDMYNEIVLGNEYDLLCPSDYMIMKLAAENRIVPYDEEFFDADNELNYYTRNVSPYINGVFENGTVEVPDKETGKLTTHSWSEYAAGYMWGTTGFVYNPDPMGDGSVDVLAELNDSEYSGWGAFTNPTFKNKITTKDNVRDTYFAALGLTYQEELLSLLQSASYDNAELTKIFNRTEEQYIDEVYETLMNMKSNIYGFETDTGKADMVSGKIWLNYAWSGDAVYALDLAEDEDDVELNYYVPEAGSNLWFDGWVMTSSVEERGTKQAAQAFVNFLSMPENAKRNSYYIGYTSVISGEESEMLDYVDYLYGVEDEEDETDENYYDLSYFFGTEAGIYADEDQRTCRQLYAQFPPEEVIERCAVMNYFDADTNERINELWSRVKAETLDAWAIIVICLTVAGIVLFVIFVKFGGKIDFFRRKPKKGYHKVDE